MMLLEMPCFASSAHTSFSGSVVQPCPHSWPSRRKRISLMRRKLELARQGVELLGLHSHFTSHGGSVTGRRGGVSQVYRRSDQQQGQVRCASCGPNAEAWQRKKIVDREKEEARRMQHTPRYRSSSSSSQAAFKQNVIRQASAAAAEGASNEAHVAYARANPDDPAQRSRDWPSANTVQHTSSAANGHESQHPATATQPSLDTEAGEQIALQQDDLHSASLSLVSSLKVKIAVLDATALTCAQDCHLQTLHVALCQSLSAETIAEASMCNAQHANIAPCHDFVKSVARCRSLSQAQRMSLWKTQHQQLRMLG